MKLRIRILVKAYPQPSTRYQETVCCAGVTEDREHFVRLYPIRYRFLPREHQFNRYDLVSLDVFRHGDGRPESYKVKEDSIELLQRDNLSDQQKVRLWIPFIADSLAALQDEQQSTGRSLGIVRPDPGTVRFSVKPVRDTAQDDQEDLLATFTSQQALFETPPKHLEPPEYTFIYSFKSGGRTHRMQIHDWEVQATWFNYKMKYGHEEAIEKIREVYGARIPKQNLHLLMGTMKARPQKFIIIGLLRSPLSPEDVERQSELFD